MNKEMIILASVIVGSMAILFAGASLANKNQSVTLKSSETAQLEVISDTNYDFGDRDIKGGNIEGIYEIKNTGSTPLDITNFKTSCACTTVQIDIKGDKSPLFGMHSSSKWKGTLQSGETATIIAVFNPMFHGPTGTGPVTRQITFDTNDTNNPSMELSMAGNVVKK